MTAAFIITGVIVGFLAGRLSCKRMYEKHLLAADKENSRLVESLFKCDALVVENQQLKSKLERVHCELDSFVDRDGAD